MQLKSFDQLELYLGAGKGDSPSEGPTFKRFFNGVRTNGGRAGSIAWPSQGYGRKGGGPRLGLSILMHEMDMCVRGATRGFDGKELMLVNTADVRTPRSAACCCAHMLTRVS